jgi:glycosyltransferase involved in cell wall biosynthesis
MDFKPDIIHVQDDPRIAGWLVYVCPRRVIKVYTNWSHDRDIQTNRQFCKGLQHFHLLTSDAPDVLEEIACLAPHLPKEIVRFGVDRSIFHPAPPNPAVLSAYGLRPDGLYILSPRSLRPNYNQLTLIRALPPIVQKFPELRLILKHHHVGNYSDSEGYEAALKEEAVRLGVWNNVVRVDHVPHAHLCELYRASRATVSIPIEDGFPATIFESMACRSPLIVSDDASYDGVAVDGVNCVRIHHADLERLTSNLLRIIEDPGFARALQDEGVKTVEEYGDFDSELSRLVTRYRLLSKRDERV